MPTAIIKLQTTEAGPTLRDISLTTDFLPRVGDTINCFDVWDDLEAEGFHFGMVYDIEWSIDGTALNHVIKVVPTPPASRESILERYQWSPSNKQK